ncbi:MAG TPA: TolC family protein [Candidatus Saccharimonadales bacterium]|jgi:cobalt-zinc-cadmium efflux system outer membrane protein|nr:TolC family protein [Candidatus Saccharimonadales bacterium]
MRSMVLSVLPKAGWDAIAPNARSWSSIIIVIIVLLGALPGQRAAGQSNAAVMFGVAPPASRQDATPLRDLIAETERNNPELAASAHGWQAVTHVAQQVSALPDTQLTVQQFAVGSPRPFAGFSNSEFAYIGIGVAQEFPYPGKHGLRAQVAHHEADSLRAQTDVVRAQIVEKLKTTYYELAYFQQSLAVVESHDQLLSEIEQIAEVRYRAGQGNQQEVLKAQLQRTKLLQEITTRRGSVERLQAMLKQLLGRPQQSADITAEPLTARPLERTPDELRLLAKEKNPAVRAGNFMLRKTETQAELARKEFRPDFNVQYMYEHTGGAFRDYYVATLGVTLPNRRRKNAELAEATERQTQAGKQLEMEMQRVLAEIQGQYALVAASDSQLKIYREGLLPQSDAVFRAALAAYHSNRQDFQTLLSSWLDRLDMELQYQHELLEHESALARLETLVGQ